MVYSNNWKAVGTGTKIAIGATTIEDATIIGTPGNQGDLIEITTLGGSRKEWAVSEILDSPEITIVAPLTGTMIAVGDTSLSCVITLQKLGKTATFTAKCISCLPLPAEVGGKLGMEIVLKPTGAVTYASA